MIHIDIPPKNTSTPITWIIPVYNGEKYLSQAVTSILNQPFQDLHVIIVDDGSTDSTLAIARSFEGNQVTVIHKENGGVSSARNVGICASDTAYLAFLDADDVLCKDAFDHSTAALLAKDEYDLISFGHFVANQNLSYGNYIPVRNEEGTNVALSIDHFKHCSSFLYRRNLFEGDDGIRFPEGIRVREDVSFQFLVNRKAQKYISIDHGLFIHRNNILSVMHNLTDTSHIIQDVIPAWVWCQEHCHSETDRLQCDILVFAEAVSYIRLSCMYGIALDKIHSTLSHSAIQQSLNKYDSLWKSRKQEYESFLSNPSRYWHIHRIQGIISGLLRRIVRLPFIRYFFLRLRYKSDIKQYLYH